MGTPGGLSQQGTTSRLQKAAQVHMKLEHPHLQLEGYADEGRSAPIKVDRRACSPHGLQERRLCTLVCESVYT